MQIGGVSGSTSAWANALRIRGGAQAPSFAPAATAKLSLRDFAGSVSALGDAIRELRLAARATESGGRGRAARAVSDTSLGLGTTPTPAVLRSTEEVNPGTTSVSTTAPTWAGLSTPGVTVGGVYDGSNGDTTLTVSSTLGGVVGLAAVDFEVRDGNGDLVDTFTVDVGEEGTAKTLSNGVEVIIDAGVVEPLDSFAFDVLTGTSQLVDPNGAFDVVGPGGANLEPGESVTTGAFFVNGQRINVDASDSIQTVLDAINNSSAGVTAAWDNDAEGVVLTQNTPGTGGAITLAGDSSGFVSAMKLADADLEFGTDGEAETSLDSVLSLAAIESGAFTINGESFTVDIGDDSLAGLIRVINASDAGVLANYDSMSGLFSIQALGRRSLVLDDGTANFFAALGIEAGVYRGEDGSREVSFASPGTLRRELRDVARSLDDVLRGDVEGYASGAAAVIRESLSEALEGAFEDVLDEGGVERLRSGLGLDLGVHNDAGRALVIDPSALGRALRRDEAGLADLLSSEKRRDGKSGLLERLDAALEAAYERLAGMLAPEEVVGLRLDVAA